MTYYSALKKNEILSFCMKMVGTDRDIKQKKPDSERQTYMLSLIDRLDLKKRHEWRRDCLGGNQQDKRGQKEKMNMIKELYMHV
jgi:hypothetical protein